MKKLKIFSVFCVALCFLMGGFFVQPAQAQVPCDFDGNGQFLINDVVDFINYLFHGGVSPWNPIDCDVDGTAGINLGDVFQCAGYLVGQCAPMPYTGLPPSFSDIEFTFPKITGGPLGVPFDVALNLTDNPGPDLMGIIITFSYQHEEGHVGVDLDNVDFTGTIVPPEWNTGFTIDNDNSKAFLWLYAGGSDNPPLPAGTIGLIATLTFTRTENPNGASTVLSHTVFQHPDALEEPAATHSPMLITDYYANGTSPPDRMVVPKYVFRLIGDVNCDGQVNIADVVYLINFLFLGGPPPLVW
jgi:hypothetical protein